MKIDNKGILITLAIVGIVLASVYTYSTKAVVTPGEVTGYIVTMDQKTAEGDYQPFTDKSFSTTIYLPRDNCEGVVNYCSWAYRDGVDTRADLNKDGVIDDTDIYIWSRAFGCTGDCLNQPIEDCFFLISGRKFKDPSDDCYMNQTDLNIWSSSFGQTYTSILNFTSSNAGKADVNKDYKVDMRDVAIIQSVWGEYANYFERYVEKASQIDLTGTTTNVPDGRIDMRDVGIITANYGEKAVGGNCETTPLVHLTGKEYSASASGIGLYYVGISYSCTI